VRREVSTLALSLVLSYVERHRPEALPALFAGLAVDEPHLRARVGWLDWATYAELNRRVRALFGDRPDLFRSIGRSMVDLEAFGFIRTMGSLLVDPRAVYRMTRRSVPAFMFPCVSIDLREPADGSIEMEYRLASGLEPLPGFFEIVHGILEVIPVVVGGDPSGVEFEWVAPGRCGRYRIRLAPKRGLLTRVRAVAANYLRWYPRAMRELEETNQRLRQQYDELQGLYDEVSAYRGRLEAMVDERTAQLSRANQALEQSVSRLEQLDRAKNELFANVSHELRTPLTMILGPVQSLLGDAAGPLDRTQRALLRSVADNSRRLLRQVNNLLDLARIDAGQTRLRFQAVEPATFVAGLLDAVRPAAEAKGLTLVASPPPVLEPLHVDPEQLEKVLLNLLGNAVKFTPAGGRIEVTVDDTTGFVRVAVADTGPGIPAEQRERIFERFTQVDGSSTRRHGGTGIGLALARQIAALHSGHIDLDSEPGRGSTFTLWLPKGTAHIRPELVDRRVADRDVPIKRRATDAELMRVADVVTDLRALQVADVDGEASAAEAPPEEAGEESGDADRPRVLVVEDDADVRRYLAFALRHHFAVATAADGLEGLAAADRLLPDAVLSDVMMPGIDGIELTRRLRRNDRTARIPVVLLTARADPDARLRGLEAEADDYLVKPFAARELIVRLGNLVRLRRFERELGDRNAELEKTLDALRRAEVELVRRARLAALGQLVAGVAHELNNPVNFLIGATQAIQERLGMATPERPLPEEMLARIRRMALVAHAGGERVAGIVENLRQFAGGGARSRGRVDLAEGIRLTVALLEPRFGEAKVTPQLELDDRLEVEGHVGELNQVVLNLLTNAIAAAPGGTVWVAGRREGEEVLVEVRDSGTGVPAEVLPHIFEPFFTTRPPGEGTGLGLAICDSIVRQHGGRIDVVSPPSQGATFRLRLPAAPDRAAAAEGVLHR
jgi:signal transduction histidine kinase